MIPMTSRLSNVLKACWLRGVWQFLLVIIRMAGNQASQSQMLMQGFTRNWTLKRDYRILFLPVSWLINLIGTALTPILFILVNTSTHLQVLLSERTGNESNNIW